jgi:hypothetical protein
LLWFSGEIEHTTSALDQVPLGHQPADVFRITVLAKQTLDKCEIRDKTTLVVTEIANMPPRLSIKPSDPLSKGNMQREFSELG